jgi:bifunctional DNA-binding transcriptional regulator/antitoxin component of YhaV-PrlF toxin-antitoxin module
MPGSYNLQLSEDGEVILPEAWQENYGLQPGDPLMLYDLGDGVLVLKMTQRRSTIDILADRIRADLEEQGETLETMLQALREERERYRPDSEPFSR